MPAALTIPLAARTARATSSATRLTSFQLIWRISISQQKMIITHLVHVLLEYGQLARGTCSPLLVSGLCEERRAALPSKLPPPQVIQGTQYNEPATLLDHPI
jgi:hypothetical protein